MIRITLKHAIQYRCKYDIANMKLSTQKYGI